MADTGKLEHYRYSPLPTKTSIRLLEILPSSDQSTTGIQCNFKVADINESPSYDALSYTWGLPCTVYPASEELPSAEAAAERNCAVICNGCKIMVTANCLGALSHLRGLQEIENVQLDNLLEREETRRIWIDSICINQAEDDVALTERAAQVQMMHQIYRQARVVIVWLGPEDAYTQDALNSLQALALLDSDKASSVRKYNSLQDKRVYEELGIPWLDSEKWVAIYALLHRAWFPRAWIVQEIASARKAAVLCGYCAFPWATLYWAAEFLRRSGWNSILMNEMRKCFQQEALSGVDERDLDKDLDMEIRDNSYINQDEYQALKRRDPTLMQCLQAIENSGSRYGKGTFRDISLHRTFTSDYDPVNLIVELTEMRFMQGNSGDLGLEVDSSEDFGANPEHLSVLLFKSRSTMCVRPEDRVYAFIGLAAEPSWKGLSVDYRRPVSQTYVQAAQAIIKSSGNIRLLSLIEDRSLRRIKTLPTWVPDFSAARHPNCLDNTEFCRFSAVGEHSRWNGGLSRQSNDIEQLTVHGIPFSAVDSLEQFKDYDLSSIKSLFDGTPDAFDVLWRTLIANQYNGEYPASADCGKLLSQLLHYHLEVVHLLMMLRFRGLPTHVDAFNDADNKFKAAFSAWQELQGPSIVEQKYLEQHEKVREDLWAISLVANQEPVLTSVTEDRVLPFHSFCGILEKLMRLATWKNRSECVRMSAKIASVNHHRALIRTKNGRLGIGPKSTESGDEIWLLAGAKVPYILRPVSENIYEFVGETYVHGIMHGEAVPEVDSQTRIITLI